MKCMELLRSSWRACRRPGGQGEVLPECWRSAGRLQGRSGGVWCRSFGAYDSCGPSCAATAGGTAARWPQQPHLQSTSPLSSQLLTIESPLQARYAHSELIKDRKAVGISKGTYLRVHYKNTRCAVAARPLPIRSS